MPVILDPDSYDPWLDLGMQNVAAASELLKPYDANLMRCYPVSTRINSVANDDEGCSVPWKLTEFSPLCFPSGLSVCRDLAVPYGRLRRIPSLRLIAGTDTSNFAASSSIFVKPAARNSAIILRGIRRSAASASASYSTVLP
jgi:hypothetical protein